MQNQHLPRLSKSTPEQTLWISAIATFGVGDVLTTVVFLTAGMNFEGHPYVSGLIGEHGIWILLPWKVGALALLYGFYRGVPDEWSIGVPLGVTLLGVTITVWNTYSSLTGARILL